MASLVTYPKDLRIRWFHNDAAAIYVPSFEDERGLFGEVWNSDRWRGHGLPSSFQQMNRCGSRVGALRGIHYQAGPRPMGKLVWCAYGAIVGLVVDLRAGSPSFGDAEVLSLLGGDSILVWVPPGFGWGFNTPGHWSALNRDGSVVEYLCTTTHDPENDHTLNALDPHFEHLWPAATTQDEPFIRSARDIAAPSWAEYCAAPAFYYQPPREEQ